jgi:hypothetical protein
MLEIRTRFRNQNLRQVRASVSYVHCNTCSCCNTWLILPLAICELLPGDTGFQLPRLRCFLAPTGPLYYTSTPARLFSQRPQTFNLHNGLSPTPASFSHPLFSWEVTSCMNFKRGFHDAYVEAYDRGRTLLWATTCPYRHAGVHMVGVSGPQLLIRLYGLIRGLTSYAWIQFAVDGIHLGWVL